QIEQLESQLANLQETIAKPEFYSGDPSEVSATLEKLSDTESQLEVVMERWVELEEQANQCT
ncbi:MAG: hypothetical protein R3309_09295, partial [Reinekea sp.]|nr:hypothetical protein [Reinekea sp.]